MAADPGAPGKGKANRVLIFSPGVSKVGNLLSDKWSCGADPVLIPLTPLDPLGDLMTAWAIPSPPEHCREAVYFV